MRFHPAEAGERAGGLLLNTLRTLGTITGPSPPLLFNQINSQRLNSKQRNRECPSRRGRVSNRWEDVSGVVRNGNTDTLNRLKPTAANFEVGNYNKLEQGCQYVALSLCGHIQWFQFPKGLCETFFKVLIRRNI